MVEEYDLIIIGGGCAGYPAAVYAARFNLKTLVIVKERGGLITTTHLVENYPGFISLSGPELGEKLEEHVKANNVPIVDDIVKSVEKKGDYFVVKTDIMEETYKTKSVILATGTKHRHLGAPGEKEFQGKGVSYCATCDGPFYKNKIVAIVGGSDSAAKEAMVLSQNSKKVYMFVRSHIKAEPINAERIKKIKNIEIIEGVNVKEIVGDDKGVNGVVLDNGKNISLDGIFIAIGMLPQNEIALSLGIKLNKKGELIIDRLSKTNVEGVFAAGDVTDAEWKQGIIASAEGSVAAYSAFEYINKKFH
ncbi:MAG: FAD-dependent oxidoreductase [Nanoarchaeota archaeon]|nr:FAD-dependent oxidoreductase [Nanoarchaeota archaeon]